MKKLLLAALIAATFSAKAQSVRVLNSCFIDPKLVVISKVDRMDETQKYYPIQSHCPKSDIPDWRVESGNYIIKSVTIDDSQEWSWFIEENGKTIKTGIGSKSDLWLMLSQNERLTIVIYSKESDGSTVDGF